MMNIKALRYITVALFLLSVSGCSSTSGSQRAALKPTFEVIPLDDAILASVESTPTSFSINGGEAFTAWRRAEIFFRQYTGLKTQLKEGFEAGLLTNRGVRSDPYIYEIQKDVGSGGYQFEVKCMPRDQRADPVLARRNAHNVARFIRDGTLELSLLAR